MLHGMTAHKQTVLTSARGCTAALHLPQWNCDTHMQLLVRNHESRKNYQLRFRSVNSRAKVAV